MANTNTPQTAAQTAAQAGDTVKNPTRAVGGSGGGAETSGGTVHLTLHFAPGQTIDPAAIYAMVDAAYGTVASLKDSVARNCYIFHIE